MVLRQPSMCTSSGVIRAIQLTAAAMLLAISVNAAAQKPPIITKLTVVKKGGESSYVGYEPPGLDKTYTTTVGYFAPRGKYFQQRATAGFAFTF